MWSNMVNVSMSPETDLLINVVVLCIMVNANCLEAGESWQLPTLVHTCIFLKGNLVNIVDPEKTPQNAAPYLGL